MVSEHIQNISAPEATVALVALVAIASVGDQNSISHAVAQQLVAATQVD